MSGGEVRPIPGVCWPVNSVNLVTPTIEQDTRSRSLASTRPMHLHEKEETEATCTPFLMLVYHQTVELVSKPESVARLHLCLLQGY